MPANRSARPFSENFFMQRQANGANMWKLHCKRGGKVDQRQLCVSGHVAGNAIKLISFWSVYDACLHYQLILWHVFDSLRGRNNYIVSDQSPCSNKFSRFIRVYSHRPRVKYESVYIRFAPEVQIWKRIFSKSAFESAPIMKRFLETLKPYLIFNLLT